MSKTASPQAPLKKYLAERAKAVRRLPHVEQREALRSTAESGDAREILLLILLLDDRRSSVRANAANALSEISPQFARIGARSILSDPTDTNRADAADVLIEHATQLDLPRLLRAMHDDWCVVRSSAAEALGMLGGRREVRALVRFGLQDREAFVRRDAAIALGGLRDPAHLQPLLDGLEREKDAMARVGYLYGLVELGELNYFAELRAMLQSEEFCIRENVLNSLLFGWEDNRPSGGERLEWIAALREMLQRDLSPAVRGPAEELLERLSRIGESSL